MNASKEIKSISLEVLFPFPNHPFNLYEGIRLDEMVKSIKENGVLEPLLVRPSDDKFEILSGHNRANAARIANLSEVPCVVILDISDYEAALVVSGTNLNQRSFSDMKHSERAKAIKLYFDAVKALGGQGKRTDLLEILESNDDTTLCQVGTKLRSAKKTADSFGLSPRTIYRYNRIALLISEFLEQLDDDKFGTIPAVNISYLSDNEQNILLAYVNKSKKRITLKISEQLKEASQNGGITDDNIAIFFISDKTDNEKVSTFKLNRNIYKKYFIDKHTNEEVNDIIDKALGAYLNSESL